MASGSSSSSIHHVWSQEHFSMHLPHFQSGQSGSHGGPPQPPTPAPNQAQGWKRLAGRPPFHPLRQPSHPACWCLQCTVGGPRGDAPTPGTPDLISGRRFIPPSEPFHGVLAHLSEETRAVVNCLVTRIIHLIEELLASPDYTPAQTSPELEHKESELD